MGSIAIAPSISPLPRGTRAVSVGVVSFLNTLPFIAGIEESGRLRLAPAPPSALIGMLNTGRVDLALCSSIDGARHAGETCRIGHGALGCDGETLTVRLFSRAPLSRLQRVAVDPDSHTSVALLRLILRECHGVDPQLVPLGEEADATLLIGDKVVAAMRQSPPQIEQLDLGGAWKQWTGFGFVFALWLARRDRVGEDILACERLLDHRCRFNLAHLGPMLVAEARGRGWPVDLAHRYLRRHLRFALTPALVRGLEHFISLCAAHDLIPSASLPPDGAMQVASGQTSEA